MQFWKNNNKIIVLKNLVMMRFMDTPVPIPNTKVKRKAAESTAGEALWEGKWLPGSII